MTSPVGSSVPGDTEKGDDPNDERAAIVWGIVSRLTPVESDAQEACEEIEALFAPLLAEMTRQRDAWRHDALTAEQRIDALNERLADRDAQLDQAKTARARDLVRYSQDAMFLRLMAAEADRDAAEAALAQLTGITPLAAPVGGQAEPSDRQGIFDQLVREGELSEAEFDAEFQRRLNAASWAPRGEPTEAAAHTLYRQHLRHWQRGWDETTEAQRMAYRDMAGDILKAAKEATNG